MHMLSKFRGYIVSGLGENDLPVISLAVYNLKSMYQESCQIFKLLSQFSLISQAYPKPTFRSTDSLPTTNG